MATYTFGLYSNSTFVNQSNGAPYTGGLASGQRIEYDNAHIQNITVTDTQTGNSIAFNYTNTNPSGTESIPTGIASNDAVLNGGAYSGGQTVDTFVAADGTVYNDVPIVATESYRIALYDSSSGTTLIDSFWVTSVYLDIDGDGVKDANENDYFVSSRDLSQIPETYRIDFQTFNGTTNDNGLVSGYVTAASTSTPGPVDGTDGADNMDIGYTDASGDMIDGADGINDVILGFGGDDTINAGVGSDTIYGGDGNDIISNTGSTGNADNQTDEIYGGAGDDTILASFGNDTIDGGDGVDHYDTSGLSGQPVTADLQAGTLDFTATASTQTITNVENLTTSGGADSITGSDADNVLITNGGADTVDGGAGNDTIDGGAGDDSLDGGTGSDSVCGGDGNDTISGGGTAGGGVPDYSTVSGANGSFAGTDGNTDFTHATTSDGNGLLEATYMGVSGYWVGNNSTAETHTHTFSQEVAGAEFIAIGINSGEFLYITLDGQHLDLNTALADGSVQISSPNSIWSVDTNGDLTSSDFDEKITVTINQPFTTLEFGTNTFGNGIIYDLSVNTDPVLMTGDDTLCGGDGDDTFLVVEGNDTITDFNLGNTGAINDGDQTNNDFVDLSGYYSQANYDAAVAAGDIDPLVIKNPLQWMQADQDDDGILNDTNAGWDADNTLTIQNGGSAVAGSDLTFDNTNVICFVRNTRIATARGEIPVEDLEVGDRVITRDNGIKQIRWIGSTKRKAEGKVAPIMFREGTVGNHRDLLVSPNHRMLVRSSEAELHTGDHETLVPAKFMVDGEGVLKVEGGTVEYFHILFDAHEIILSDGSWTESFHPGQMGWSSLCEDSRQEILALFPELTEGFAAVDVAIARQVLDRRESMLVMHAMKRDGIAKLLT